MNSWKASISVYRSPKMAVMAVLGFFSGLPLVLLLSTLAYWLAGKGVSKTDIALFSLTRFPYSFKFLWAPYVDRCKIPVLTKALGQRRSWALLFQVCLMISLAALIRTNPAVNPMLTGVCAIAVAFFSASQDIVLDAFRVEDFDPQDQGAASGCFVFGYRIGMLAAGAGALYMAQVMSWENVYTILALSGIIGMATILAVKEPKVRKETADQKKFFKTAVVAPIKDFIARPGWFLIILFIMLYKLCETTLGTMTAPFYVELGFSYDQIATVVKLYGIAATILGGFLGGIAVVRWGIMRSLLICGILQGISNLPFAYLATQGNSLTWLMISVISDNLTSAMATSAFVAYMSFLCNAAYTATQYALLSSLMALPRDMLSSMSGWLADHTTWPVFFMITASLCLPGLIVLWFLNRRFPQKAQVDTSADTP
ncbi:MAG: AmpG family muropeptide MFS transporter [Alphaproteobacteria bacterium]|nr:AmpG family muropeptide MFS transporter [Alphaproteobacteria bacterium]